MPSDPLILAMAAHILWTAVLYAALTLARAPTVWGVGKAADGSNPFAASERRFSANLGNQFEWPLFFYVICLLIVLGDHPRDPIQTGLAWLFVTGRILHSVVQIGSTNIRLRGIVFTINFLAVLAMWARYLLASG